jgi:L-ascorbate metabolism protein UlaG (beta-lactamase superfamily)
MVAGSKRLSCAISRSSSIDRPLSFRFTYKEICGNQQTSCADDGTRYRARAIGFRGCSHLQSNHTDHLDGETLIPLLTANPNLKVIVSRTNVNFAAERLQVSAERLTPIRVDDDAINVGPFDIYAIPSAHEILERDENGDYKCIGLIVQVGGQTIYHSGDAIPYEGLVETLKHWRIDIAILPINGRDSSRGVPGNFTGQEAAELGKQINAGMVVPCHYEMFEFNTVQPEEFLMAASKINQPYQILKYGERLSL